VELASSPTLARFHLRQAVERGGDELAAQIEDAQAPFWHHVCAGVGVSELLAGVLVTVEDISLDATIPSLPGSEIDVHFPACLGLTRRAWEVHDEFMRPSAFGNAASLPQELLQVEDLVRIADIDVHAAGRSGVAATESPVSLSSQTPVCQ
jgi:hypothetical protein